MLKHIGFFTMMFGIMGGDSEQMWFPIALIAIGAMLFFAGDKGDY